MIYSDLTIFAEFGFGLALANTIISTFERSWSASIKRRLERLEHEDGDANKRELASIARRSADALFDKHEAIRAKTKKYIVGIILYLAFSTWWIVLYGSLQVEIPVALLLAMFFILPPLFPFWYEYVAIRPLYSKAIKNLEVDTTRELKKPTYSDKPRSWVA